MDRNTGIVILCVSTLIFMVLLAIFTRDPLDTCMNTVIRATPLGVTPDFSVCKDLKAVEK